MARRGSRNRQPATEWLVTLIRELKQALIREISTTAGRVNALGMILAAFVIVVASATRLIEIIVEAIRPEVDLGFPLLGIFLAFLAFSFACVLLLAYLEGRSGSPNRGS